MSGHIYLLCEREFIASGEPIYKLGRTKNVVTRFSQYPKGSEFWAFHRVDQVNETEYHLLKLFREIYIQRTDIGREYFEGDVNLMMQTLLQTLQQTLLQKIMRTPIDHINEPIEVIPATYTIQDPTNVVIEFVETMRDEFSNQILKSREVYEQLCEWIEEKRYKVKISHCKFTRELMLSFKVHHGVHRFPQGLTRALYFPDLTPPTPELNTLLMFLEARCIASKKHSIPCAEFLEEYNIFSGKDWGRKQMKNAMEKHKYVVKVVNVQGKSTRCFAGLGMQLPSSSHGCHGCHGMP